MWGSTGLFSPPAFALQIFPTDVGINRIKVSEYEYSTYIPHGCGDQPGDVLVRNKNIKYSPRMWGSTEWF